MSNNYKSRSNNVTSNPENGKARGITRREFLETSAIMCAAGYLAACAPSLSETIAPSNPAAGNQTPPAIPPTAGLVFYEPPVPQGSTFEPALNPPEYKALAIEISGIDPKQLEEYRYTQWYRLYKQVNGLEGEPSPFSGAGLEEARQKFEQAMQQFSSEHPEVEVRQVQSEDRASLLTYLVRQTGEGYAVYWGFAPDGAVAFAEPDLVENNTVLGEVAVPEGLRPEFVYNPEDRHWYLFAVDEQGEAIQWFRTDGATRNNLLEQWTKVGVDDLVETVWGKAHFEQDPETGLKKFVGMEMESGNIPAWKNAVNLEDVFIVWKDDEQTFGEYKIYQNLDELRQQAPSKQEMIDFLKSDKIVRATDSNGNNLPLGFDVSSDRFVEDQEIWLREAEAIIWDEPQLVWIDLDGDKALFEVLPIIIPSGGDLGKPTLILAALGEERIAAQAIAGTLGTDTTFSNGRGDAYISVFDIRRMTEYFTSGKQLHFQVVIKIDDMTAYDSFWDKYGYYGEIISDYTNYFYKGNQELIKSLRVGKLIDNQAILGRPGDLVIPSTIIYKSTMDVITDFAQVEEHRNAPWARP